MGGAGQSPGRVGVRAWDPLSGQVALLSEAKAIGSLLKSGWKPRRTLVYASWDGEEPGLLGSTEGPRRTPRIAAQGGAVSELRHQYARLPPRGRQPLAATPGQRRGRSGEGSRDRRHLTGATARPDAGGRLREGSHRRKEVADEKMRNAKLAAAGGDLPIAALGSGSDYTPSCSTWA